MDAAGRNGNRSRAPRGEGHQQPKVPAWGYEDEADPSVMARKIDVGARTIQPDSLANAVHPFMATMGQNTRVAFKMALQAAAPST